MTRTPNGSEPGVVSGAKAFDRLSGQYASQLSQGLKLSGEDAEYFVRRRIQYTRRLADSHGLEVRSILDFGCGVGTALPLLADAFPGAVIVGYEPARDLREICLERIGATLQCVSTLDDVPRGSVDLIYCNGVFHHIPPPERTEAVRRAAACLKSAAAFALWENNPWSPAARLVMSRIPFDRDAVMIWPGQARRLLTTAGMTSTSTRYQFVFPRAMAPLRPLERYLERIAVGAQYVVFATRSQADARV